MRLLSRFRDLQVQQLLLAPMAPGYPGLGGYLSRLKGGEARSRPVLSASLSAFPLDRLAEAAYVVERRLRLVTAESRAEANAIGRLEDRLNRDHQRLLALRSCIDPADPATIHRLRVAFKKYRYLVEPLAPLSGNHDPAVLARMHELQGLMGDIQDLAVLLRSLRSWAAKHHGLKEVDPIVRLLARRLSERISAFLNGAKEMDSFVFPFKAGK